jgi:hypothetical protein
MVDDGGRVMVGSSQAAVAHGTSSITATLNYQSAVSASNQGSAQLSVRDMRKYKGGQYLRIECCVRQKLHCRNLLCT